MPNTGEITSKKRKKTRRHRLPDRRLFFASTAAFTLLYLAGCYLVFRNQQQIDTLRASPMNMTVVEEAARYPALHDTIFFREYAERMTYYPHDPKLARRFFQLALEKGPSSHEPFFSYASYLTTLDCCRDQVLYLLQETVRRCPTHPRMHRIAATYFLNLDERQKALPFVRKALELSPETGPELFRMLRKGGTPVDTIVEMTPAVPEAQIQLAGFLSGIGDSGRAALGKTLTRLGTVDLTARQRLRVAEIAMRSGNREIARRQSELASTDDDVQAEAWALQVRMLWSEGRKEEAVALADRVEEAYRKKGTGDQAVRYALEIASVLWNLNDRTASRERMLRILDSYPTYAPAFYQMAQFSRGESEEVELFYLRKACDLAPDNLEYRKMLARRLLETGHLQEAESAFGALVHVSGAEKEAFLGLSQCRSKNGDNLGAIRVLEQAVQRGVVDDRLLFELGRLYSLVGEYEKSALTFLKYADTQRGNAEAHNLAGEAYMNMGRFKSAREQYRRALERDPNNKRARDALANLEALGY